MIARHFTVMILRLGGLLLGMTLILQSSGTVAFAMATPSLMGSGFSFTDFIVPLIMTGIWFAIPLLLFVLAKPLSRILCPIREDEGLPNQLRPGEIETLAIVFIGVFTLISGAGSAAEVVFHELASRDTSFSTEGMQTHSTIGAMARSGFELIAGALLIFRARSIAAWIRRRYIAET